MDNIQQHIEKLREAINPDQAMTHTDYQQLKQRMFMMSPVWHQQSIELLEQQQREIDGLKKKLQASRDSVYGISIEGDEARCELNEAKAEIERLREALVYTQIGIGNAYEYGYLKETGEGDVQMMIDRINAALSPKEEQSDG